MRKRTFIWRVSVAVLISIALWGIASLSDTYTTTLKVPLRLELPQGQTPIDEAPSYVEVMVRAQGWSLLKMIAAGRTEVVVGPGLGLRMGDSERVVHLTSADLLSSIRVPSNAQQLRVTPDSLTLVIVRVGSKRVPVYSEVRINPRAGFQVIGSTRLVPDSITLIGAEVVLQDISAWHTQPLDLTDVHGPIRQPVRVSDTLRGVVTANEPLVELYADVQEVAERSFSNIPLINRGAIRDTHLSLSLQPSSISVTLRGGVGDLSTLSPRAIGAYLDIQEGIDTLGIARPRLILPPGFSVVSVVPDRVRYVYRREM